MRVLLAPEGASGGLEDLYAFPGRRWVRANFVSTLDGAATGHDGVTGSINTPFDNRVFALQRRLCDAVVVGAGTVRAEGYERLPVEPGRPTPALVVVSGSGHAPAGLIGPKDGRGRGVLVTCEAAGEVALDRARRLLGPDDVWVCGTDHVDLAAMVDRVVDEAGRAVLLEGGPTLFASMLAAALVDELALTVAPRLVGGDGRRITDGGWVDLDAAPRVLVEQQGTLIGLWRVRRARP